MAERRKTAGPDWDQLLARPAWQASWASAAQISFSASRPPEDLFPIEDFRQSVAEVLASGRLEGMLQLGPPGGYEPLRHYLLEEARH